MITSCPDCDAPLLSYTESCARTSLHSRRVCDIGRTMWAMLAASETYGTARAHELAAAFLHHRSLCGECTAEVHA